MRLRFPAVAALILLGFLATAPAAADLCLDDPGTFQVRIQRLVSDFYVAAERAALLQPDNAEVLRQSIADFEQVVLFASPEQMQALCEVFASHPELADAPRMIESLVDAVPQNATSCIRLNRAQFLGIFVTAQVLKGVAAVLETTCKATECISLVCKVTCAIAGVANGAVLVFDSILEENDYCGKSFHFEFMADFVETTDESLAGIEEALETQVVPPLDVVLSTRSTQASIDLLDSTVASGFTDVDMQAADATSDLTAQATDREAFQGSSLQQRIEEDLQAAEVGPIVRFQMPESVGGLLEQVREVVAQALLDNLAASHDIGEAFDLFGEGDTALNSQAYKSAYSFYGEAYRAAVGSLSGGMEVQP